MAVSVQLAWPYAISPVGTAYAVWTAAYGTVLLAHVPFEEPATVGRLLCVGLIIAGIVSLKLTGPAG